MKAGAVLRAVMTGKTQPGTIPFEYLTTDRILERFFSDAGSGLPTEAWDDTKKARPVPLDDDTWLAVNRILLSLPKRSQESLDGWYKSPLPTSAQAHRAGMELDKYCKIHVLQLHFMKDRMERSKHPTLLRLLSALG